MGIKDLKSKAHVYISGKVQGVFFRSYIQEQAEFVGVTGWARNLTDGRVEAVFEGSKGDIDKIIELCRCGPPLSRVDNVEIVWDDYTGEYQNFIVLPSK